MVAGEKIRVCVIVSVRMGVRGIVGVCGFVNVRVRVRARVRFGLRESECW